MKTLLLLCLCSIPVWADEPEVQISLITEIKMGVRAGAQFQNFEWKTDSEWFHRPAPVCKAGGQPLDLTKFKEFAESYGMTPNWTEYAEREFGKRADGAFSYIKIIPNKYKGAYGSPLRRKFGITLEDYSDFDRDENMKPLVKTLPSREEAFKIARSWMAKLGIPESELYQKGSGPDGFEVKFRVDLVRANEHGTNNPKEFRYGISLNFAQQIGGLSVFWNGYGGTVACDIADGGEFSAMKGTLSGWEKLGDYQVLNKEEITTALKEGFYWVPDPFACERIEITKVYLEVFHDIEARPQKNFPLVYILICKMHGGADDGYEETIYLPALKQQRQKYGLPPKLPEPKEENKDPNAVAPAKMLDF